MSSGYRRALMGCVAMGLLSACSMTVHRVELDPSRLASKSKVRVACAYRQGDVVDARPSTGRAGGLGSHLFLVEDASRIVRERLAAAGIAAAGEGQVVDVRLLHLYMTQNQGTKIPVVVLSASVGKQPTFTLRSQKASMNWNGSEEEAYEGYSRAFDDAMAQLVAFLDKGCGKD